MALVRVGYKRTFQTRPYETQVIEVSVEAEVGKKAVEEQATYAEATYRVLDQLGDTLMRDALAKPDSAGRK